jgi:hypothetical protein
MSYILYIEKLKIGFYPNSNLKQIENLENDSIYSPLSPGSLS